MTSTGRSRIAAPLVDNVTEGLPEQSRGTAARLVEIAHERVVTREVDPGTNQPAPLALRHGRDGLSDAAVPEQRHTHRARFATAKGRFAAERSKSENPKS